MSENEQINTAALIATIMAIVIGLMSENITAAVLTFLGVFALALTLMSIEDRGL